MDESQPIAHVLRVIRHDTLQLRAWCPLSQTRVTLYMVPCGVWCMDDAKEHIIDWCELHADADRLKLVTFDHMRDEYGRLMGDLADIQSGETLTSYLLSVGVAKPRPHHILEMLGVLLSSTEVEDAGG